MINPCFITSNNNTTQKFILFFSIPSNKRLTGINSLLLVFVGQLLWDPYGRYFGKFQTLVDDCLNRTNIQAQFVRYFTNRDTSINEHADFTAFLLLRVTCYVPVGCALCVMKNGAQEITWSSSVISMSG